MEGIWLWTVPVYNDLLQTNLFFLQLSGIEPGHSDYSKFMAVFCSLCSSFVVMTQADSNYTSSGGQTKDLVSQLSFLTTLNTVFEQTEAVKYSIFTRKNPYFYLPQNLIWVIHSSDSKDVPAKTRTFTGRKAMQYYLEGILTVGML